MNGVLPSERGWIRELLPLGALSALLTLIAAGSAVLALSQTVRTGHQLGELSQAQRLHQDADMMHDALHADVAVAERLRRGGSPAERAKAVRQTDLDAAQFRRDLNQLRTVTVPSDVRPQVVALHGPRERYVAMAVQAVHSELRGEHDPQAARRFQLDFDTLVTRQRDLTETLASAARRVERDQDRHERRIATVLVLALAVVVVGWAVLVAMLRRTGRSLLQALRREADQRAVTEQLQRTLLPERLPDVPGLRLAARSRAADSAMRVGGDWYDVIGLPSGNVGLVVGDVAGHDLEAATAMTQLRAALRAFAVYDPSPAAVLTRLNTVADLLQVTDLTTCVYVVVNPATRTARWSSAGHLNPLVVRPDGQGQVLDGDPGPPIGVADDAVFVDQVCELEPNGLMMLFTDGLVERRSTSITENLDRLERMRSPHIDPEGLCDHVLQVMLADDSDVQDDVTLLALQADGSHPPLH